MSRVQLALRVADLEGSVAFYSRLFGAGPAKRRPGYANFAIAEPPLKLVLIEGTPGEPTRMDHLGRLHLLRSGRSGGRHRAARPGSLLLTSQGGAASPTRFPPPPHNPATGPADGTAPDPCGFGNERPTDSPVKRSGSSVFPMRMT
jgi:catechol 2,3-dioxygenase-like lactoylglutathione lyase family enzyme